MADEIIVRTQRAANADGGSKREWLEVGTPVSIVNGDPNEWGYIKITVIATGKSGYVKPNTVGTVPIDPPVEPPVEPPTEQVYTVEVGKNKVEFEELPDQVYANENKITYRRVS